MGIELSHTFGRAPLALRRPQIEETAAGHSALRRRVAQNEPVADRRGNRPFEHQLHSGFAAGQNRFIAKQHNSRRDAAGRVVQPNGQPLRKRLRFTGEQV